MFSKKIPFSKVIEKYHFMKLNEKELVDNCNSWNDKFERSDEFDYSSRENLVEIFSLKNFESCCEQIKNDVKIVTPVLEEWFKKTKKVKRDQNIWSKNEIKNWEKRILDSIKSMKKNVSNNKSINFLTISRFSDSVLDGWCQLQIVLDFLELPRGKIILGFIWFLGVVFGVIIEKIFDLVLSNFPF